MTELRHITSINDLTNHEIETTFSLADKYLSELGDIRPTGRTRKKRSLTTHRIGRSGHAGAGSILASLFYEPSTRTRLSFESAMLRLGGGTITSSDPATSSAAKGESLADTVRVVSSYADAIVIRHPRDGAAKLAAQYASIPVINAGDGGHEHPTQTLCDLFTLYRREKQRLKNLNNLNVVISGDLRGSRTVHSFVYALARFKARIQFVPGAAGMGLPPHVEWRLRNEFHCLPEDRKAGEDDVDLFYVTADQSHQLSLITPEIGIKMAKAKKAIDVIYVTRFQKERWKDQVQSYMKVDSAFLKDNKYKRTSVLHPLPRVGELDIALDRNPRAAYFQQASFGVPVRMALIAALLDFEGQHSLEKFASGFRPDSHVLYEQPHGIVCANPNCIVHDPLEGLYAANKHYIVDWLKPRLRCFYCENDIENFYVGHKKTRHYGLAGEAGKHMRDVILFADRAAAEAAGYKPRKSLSGAAKA
jgi:aspartate carbamoyltransferase catalytic subunit